jgi:hypothetical protein
MTITYTMNIEGSLGIEGSGKLVIQGELNLLGGGEHSISGWDVENKGTTNWTGTNIVTEDVTFTNKAGAIFNAEEWAGDWNAVGGAFVNQGTFNSSGWHTLAIEFASSMAVNVVSGALTLMEGGGVSNAAEIAQGGTLSFMGGTFVFPSLTVQGNGLMLQWGAYTVVQGTVNAQNYELRTGTLDGPGTLAIAQTFAWTGGTMTGTGTTSLLAGALGEIAGPTGKVLDRRSFTVANNATVDYIGGTLTMANTANLANSGTFQILGDLNILDGGGSPAATITNNGTFRKAQSEGGASSIEVTFNNVSGTISVDAGVLQFTYLQSINAAATLIIATNTQCQVAYLNFFDGAVQGAGTLSTLSGGTINWFKGSATGTGKISITGSGSIMHIAGPLALNGFSLENFGTVSWDAGDITTAAGTIISNQPGATFAALSDNALTGTGTFNNSGTFSKLLGAVATGQTRIAVPFNNKAAGGSAAEVHAIQGAISFQGAGTHDSLFNAPVGGAIEFLGPNSVQIALQGTRFTGMGGIYLTTFATIIAPLRLCVRLNKQLPQRRVTNLDDLQRVGLPERLVHQLQRNPAGITKPPEVVEERLELEVAVAGHDAVAVRGAQMAEVLELAGPGVVVEHVEVDSEVRLLALLDESQGRVEAGAKGMASAKLQRQLHVERGRPLRRLFERDEGPLQLGAVNRAGEVGGDDQRANAKLLAQVETPAEMIVMSPALFPL